MNINIKIEKLKNKKIYVIFHLYIYDIFYN